MNAICFWISMVNSRTNGELKKGTWLENPQHALLVMKANTFMNKSQEIGQFHVRECDTSYVRTLDTYYVRLFENLKIRCGGIPNLKQRQKTSMETLYVGRTSDIFFVVVYTLFAGPSATSGIIRRYQLTILLEWRHGGFGKQRDSREIYDFSRPHGWAMIYPC